MKNNSTYAIAVEYVHDMQHDRIHIFAKDGKMWACSNFSSVKLRGVDICVNGLFNITNAAIQCYTAVLKLDGEDTPAVQSFLGQMAAYGMEPYRVTRLIFGPAFKLWQADHDANQFGGE